MPASSWPFQGRRRESYPWDPHGPLSPSDWHKSVALNNKVCRDVYISAQHGWQGLAVVFINCPLAVTLCQWSGPNLCRQISLVQKWKLMESLAANSSRDTLYKLAYFVKPSPDNTPHPTTLPLSLSLFHLSHNIIHTPSTHIILVPKWLMVCVCLMACEARYLMCVCLCVSTSIAVLHKICTLNVPERLHRRSACVCAWACESMCARVLPSCRRKLLVLMCYCAAWWLIMTLNVYEHWSAIAPKWEPFHILTGHCLTAYWWMHNHLQ